MIAVPEVVRNKAEAVGAEWWLDQLPGIVAELDSEWGIEIGNPFPDATEAFVAAATTDEARRRCSTPPAAAATPSTTRGSMAVFPVVDDSHDAPPLAVHYVPNLVHHTGAYVTAFVEAGLAIESCLEPEITDRAIQGYPSHALYPEATRRAVEGLPYLLVWQARKPSPPTFGLAVR